MRKLTLEERVERIEKYIINEFLWLNKATAEDGKNLINKIKEYPSLKSLKLYGGSLSSKALHITIGLPTKLSNKLNGLGFIIAAKGDNKNNLYCTAHDDTNRQIATLSPVKLSDVKKIAEFIFNQIKAAKERHDVKESKLRKYESISLDEFTCKQLEDFIADRIGNEYDITIDDTEALSGVIEIVIHSPDGWELENTVRAVDYNKYEILDGGSVVKRCTSLIEVADYFYETIDEM